MSVEPLLLAVVTQVCPAFHWDQAEEGTAAPYVVAQAVGGQTLRALDGTPADKRNTAMQIAVWAGTRKESTELARRIEDAICASTAFQASPMGEPVSLADPQTRLRGCLQTFSIWSAR